MEVIFINREEVRQLLPMSDCIEVMTQTFAALARGETVMPRRIIMWLPEKIGALGTMPAYLDNLKMIGLKAITVFPGNHNTKYHTHQGVVMLFDGKHGFPRALVDAVEITAIRTAAASAVGTKLLARPDASDLVILGSGVQAVSHLEAMRIVRDIKRVRVWNPFPGLAQEFARTQSERLDIEIEAQSGEKADISKADIICTTTSSHEPVLFGADLPAGVHVNAVGSSFPHARELDTEAVLRSRFFVDLRDSALNEAGDFLFPKNEGAVGDDHIQGEIGEVLVGQNSGRNSDDEITVFEALGLAVEDAAAAWQVYSKAQEKGVGVRVNV